MNLNDTITIHFHDIKWDIDEDDKDIKIPSTDFIQVFTGYDLTNHFGKRDHATGEFFVNNDELDEFLSNWLSDEFGFCHKGFHWNTCSEK